MAFVNKIDKAKAAANAATAAASAEKPFTLLGKKVDKKFLLIPAVILVSGLLLSIWLRSRRKAGSAISGASSTVQGAAQSAARAASEAVQPVVEKAREVFRFGQY